MGKREDRKRLLVAAASSYDRAHRKLLATEPYVQQALKQLYVALKAKEEAMVIYTKADQILRQVRGGRVRQPKFR